MLIIKHGETIRKIPKVGEKICIIWVSGAKSIEEVYKSKANFFLLKRDFINHPYVLISSPINVWVAID